LEFDSEVGSANHTQLKFQEATHLPCSAWVGGIILNDKSLQPEFSKQIMWFLD